ncbi:43370_t:CDS:2, partial [Gigaspora margarita]
TKIHSDFKHEAIVFSRTVLDRINAIEEQLTKDEKTALTNSIKKTYEVTATAKDAHLILKDGRTSAIRHENSLYQRLLHLINSEEERILIKDQLEEIDKEVEVQLEENINHEKIDKNSLRDLKYNVDDLNTPHPKLPVVHSLVFVFSDVTSQVVGTPNKGRLIDFLWIDGEYITELSYIMGKYINGIEIKTNSGHSTGWQGSQSG